MPAFSDLTENMFDSFVNVIEGFSQGLKNSFSNLIYLDPTAENLEFSPLVIFLFVGGGLALAMGVFYKVFGMIRGVAKK